MTAIGPKKKPHRPSLHENAGLSRLTPHSREIVIPVGHAILWFNLTRCRGHSRVKDPFREHGRHGNTDRPCSGTCRLCRGHGTGWSAGKVIGSLLSGIVTGILAARSVAGIAADLGGWRAVSALLTLLMVGFVLWTLLDSPSGSIRGLTCLLLCRQRDLRCSDYSGLCPPRLVGRFPVGSSFQGECACVMGCQSRLDEGGQVVLPLSLDAAMRSFARQRSLTFARILLKHCAVVALSKPVSIALAG